jgi:hypothetical protein
MLRNSDNHRNKLEVKYVVLGGSDETSLFNFLLLHLNRQATTDSGRRHAPPFLRDFGTGVRGGRNTTTLTYCLEQKNYGEKCFNKSEVFETVSN